MTADRYSATHVLFTSKSHHIHHIHQRIGKAMNSSNAPIAKPARAAVAQQPTGAIQMVPTSAPAGTRQQQPGEQKAMRIRGGGAAKNAARIAASAGQILFAAPAKPSRIVAVKFLDVEASRGREATKLPDLLYKYSSFGPSSYVILRTLCGSWIGYFDV
ncbi:hypothetical protein ACEPAH_8981 [Sanghuangporus vaninii]